MVAFRVTSKAGDILALSAGCLLPLAFAPLAWWPCAVVSVVVLLFSLEGVSALRAGLRGYLYGLGMYGIGVSWIFVSIHEYGPAPVPLAALLVALFVAALSIIPAAQLYVFARWFRFGLILKALSFAGVWVLQEWVRTWLLTGFPWLLTGYAFVDTWLVAWAPVQGVLLVSFMAVATGSLLHVILCRPKANVVLMCLALIATAWGVGLYLGGVEWSMRTETISVSTVQGNVDQGGKWRKSNVTPIVNLYLRLTDSEWGRDLVVWPEASITLFRRNARALIDALDQRGRDSGTSLIMGIPTGSLDTGSYRNTVIGLGKASGEYHKRRLVPFGEYVPLEGLLRGLIRFFDLPMSHSEPGTSVQEGLRLDGRRVAVSICYEVAYPELVRETVPDPALLITISNDTWFGRSVGPLQHLQMARMRAVENHRYLVRATNNGVSAIIDHKGNITHTLPQFQEGILRGEADIRNGKTFYARWGHLPLLVLVSIMLIAGLVKGRESS